MLKFLIAALLAIGTMIGSDQVVAQANTRAQIQMIEEEYARQNNGRMIPDDQLEYYLDQSNAGWSMNQISQDMANSQRQYANSTWRPREGWIAREVICSSINSQYRECAAPFRGTAIITQQISQSACIEGQSWGQRPGYIWVNRGCRARFGIVRTSSDNYPDNNRIVVCQSNRNRYRECLTGFRGRVELVRRLNNSKACIAGRSWGQREGMVWVSRGCRAQFASVNRFGNRDDRGWYRDRNYSVTCSSMNNLMTRCDWDSRYGNPRLIQQLSTQACINGRNWGYDSRGIWVDHGCRASFGAE